MPGHSLGVWFPTDFLQAGAAQEFAVGLEGLGYSTLWIPETTGRDPFAHSAHLFSATSELEIATGIASIYHRHPGVMAQCAKTLAEQSQGRFVLGLGVSHAHRVTELRGLEYGKPVATMRDYLTALWAAPYTARASEAEFKTVIAALGPKMLELAAEVVDGAHTYWCTPEHTALASKILGPGKELCVEQKVVLCEDPELARLVELRFFGCCELDEIASVMHLSERTVKRRWQLAKGWLHREVIREVSHGI